MTAGADTHTNCLETMGHRKRVLLITYPFPPVGGAGVQRVTKFTKYLPRHGWDVSVLTVANPSVPLFDESLVLDVPPETLIYRAYTWEPSYEAKASVAAGNNGPARTVSSIKKIIGSIARRLGTLLLQPDSQILWMPGAVAEGRRLLRKVRHDLIVASGPPFSTFLIASALGRHLRLPVILDYRDEWTISNEYWENKNLDRLSRSVQKQMQRRVFRTSSGLVATTHSSADSLRRLSSQCGSNAPVICIYNGFDPDDFEVPAAPPASDGRFRLTYTGTLWNLTSVAPLVAAVKRIASAAPELAAMLEIVFAGRRLGQQAELVGQLRGLPCRVQEHPYLKHSEAVSLMRGSEANCLLLSDLPGSSRVVPAKLFEYIATGKPILTIAPLGETRELLRNYPGGQFSPHDDEGIAIWITNAIRDHQQGHFGMASGCDAAIHTRDNQSKQLAEFMTQCCLRLTKAMAN